MAYAVVLLSWNFPARPRPRPGLPGDVSHFLLSALAAPASRRCSGEGRDVPYRALPSAWLRPSGRFCSSGGWMRDSLIIRDYCSITSFHAEVMLWIPKWVTYGGVLEPRGCTGRGRGTRPRTVRTPTRRVRRPPLCFKFSHWELSLVLLLKAVRGEKASYGTGRSPVSGENGRSRHEPASPQPSAEHLPCPCRGAPAPQRSAPGHAVAGAAGRWESRPATSPSPLPSDVFCC